MVTPEDLTFLKNNAYISQENTELGWTLLKNHCDQSATTVAAEHVTTQPQRDSLKKLAHGVIRGLRRAGHRLQDSDWEFRFEECLQQNGVRLLLNMPEYPSRNREKHGISYQEYYAQCIQYIRCAAYFVKTDLSEVARETKKIELDTLDTLRMSGYLQCDLRDR
jgi:hypothetical protein